MEIFGHVFSATGIAPDPAKVQAIVKMKALNLQLKYAAFSAWQTTVSRSLYMTMEQSSIISNNLQRKMQNSNGLENIMQHSQL